MKNLLKIVTVFLIVGLQLSFTVANEKKLDCSMLRSGTFTYTDDDGDEVVVIVDGDNHTEYYKERKYSVESKIKWNNDCQFDLVLTKATLPRFPYKKGAVLSVSVESIQGNIVYYSGTIKGKTYKGSMKKQGTESEFSR